MRPTPSDSALHHRCGNVVMHADDPHEFAVAVVGMAHATAMAAAPGRNRTARFTTVPEVWKRALRSPQGFSHLDRGGLTPVLAATTQTRARP